MTQQQLPLGPTPAGSGIATQTNHPTHRPFGSWVAVALGCMGFGVVLGLSGCADNTAPSPIPTEQAVAREQSDSTALDALNAAILAAPSSPDAYQNRAMWYIEHGQPKQALADFNLAIAADSAFAPAWERKSDLLYAMQAFEPCLEHLDACIAAVPSTTACRLRRAEFAIHLRQYEEAFTYLNDALRIDDQLHEAYWMKGKIYEETGANDKAASSYATAVEVNPEFFDGFITLGIFHAERGNPIAEEYYRSAREIEPGSVEPIYNLAIFLQDAGRYDEALSLYKDMLAIDPQNATAAYNQGFIFLEYFQSYDSANHWFTEAIERLPYYHQAFYNRGLARESMNQTDSALADYNEALRLQPDYTSAAMAKERVLNNE